MINIKLRLKIKNIKKKLIATWYFLMKPIAYLIKKSDRYHNYRYNNKQDKINSWTDEKAIELFSKILIKQFIRCNNRSEVFVVAEYGNVDEDIVTIRDHLISQRENQDLKSWGYKLPYFDVNRIEKLTELLRIELGKYNEIKCEYIVDKAKYSYCGRSSKYVKTLIVKFNSEEKRI